MLRVFPPLWNVHVIGLPIYILGSYFLFQYSIYLQLVRDISCNCTILSRNSAVKRATKYRSSLVLLEYNELLTLKPNKTYCNVLNSITAVQFLKEKLEAKNIFPLINKGIVDRVRVEWPYCQGTSPTSIQSPSLSSYISLYSPPSTSSDPSPVN